MAVELGLELGRSGNWEDGHPTPRFWADNYPGDGTVDQQAKHVEWSGSLLFFRGTRTHPVIQFEEEHDVIQGTGHAIRLRALVRRHSPNLVGSAWHAKALRPMALPMVETGTKPRTGSIQAVHYMAVDVLQRQSTDQSP